MLKSEQAKNPSIESANKTDRPLLAKIGNQVKIVGDDYIRMMCNT